MYLQLNFTILSLIFEKLLSSAVSSAPSSVIVIEASIFGEFSHFTQAFLIRFLYLDLFTLPSSSFGQNWRQAALGLTASDSQKVHVVYVSLFFLLDRSHHCSLKRSMNQLWIVKRSI